MQERIVRVRLGSAFKFLQCRIEIAFAEQKLAL